jgi:hypothetical protein
MIPITGVSEPRKCERWREADRENSFQIETNRKGSRRACMSGLCSGMQNCSIRRQFWLDTQSVSMTVPCKPLKSTQDTQHRRRQSVRGRSEQLSLTAPSIWRVAAAQALKAAPMVTLQLRLSKSKKPRYATRGFRRKARGDGGWGCLPSGQTMRDLLFVPTVVIHFSTV